MKNLPHLTIIICILTLLPNSITAQQRSIEEVLTIIENQGAKLLNPNTFAKHFRSKSYDRKTASLTASTDIGGLGKQTTDNAFYIYSPSVEDGFIIVSADKRMSPVLAYSDTGSIDTQDLPDNVKLWLAGYVVEYQNLDQNTTKSINIDGWVDPLITTLWGQNYPYNNLCPLYNQKDRAVTGCIATAMAQIMNYHRYPDVGRGANSYVSDTYGIELNRNFANTTFHWELLKDSYKDYATNEEINAIADLMLTCGISVNMDYGSISWAYYYRILLALVDNFGYDPDISFIFKDDMSPDLWHNTITEELLAERPIIMTGSKANGEGHAFIIDGYQSDPEDYPYYHLNWGWNGYADGYYKMSNMCYNSNPDNAYTKDLAAIVNIKPYDNLSKLDINNDGEINSTDVIAIYNYINNPENSPCTLQDVDLNGDDVANSSDVIMIYNHIVSN